MFNSKGQPVTFEATHENGIVTVDTSGLSRGLYLVYISDGATTRAEKIILQ